jgi:hypothetical protein
MDRVDHQLHVEHLFSLTASSIATGNVVVAVVVVAVHCSFSLSPNLGSVLFFCILVIRGCIIIMAGVNV